MNAVYLLYQMDFELDPAKSAASLEKHGIDFKGALALWSDPDRLEIIHAGIVHRVALGGRERPSAGDTLLSLHRVLA